MAVCPLRGRGVLLALHKPYPAAPMLSNIQSKSLHAGVGGFDCSRSANSSRAKW